MFIFNCDSSERVFRVFQKGKEIIDFFFCIFLWGFLERRVGDSCIVGWVLLKEIYIKQKEEDIYRLFCRSVVLRGKLIKYG